MTSEDLAMADSHPFERPQPSEKLSYKFILDCLNETLEEKEDTEALIETQLAPETEPFQEELPEEVLERHSVEEIQAATSTPKADVPLTKKYYRIGEVADLIGVEPYVLRYWEGEFSSLRPTKTGSGHRIYARKDVETLQTIRRLLHDEKFSIKGAKQRLIEMKKQAKAAPSATKTANTAALRELAHELKALIQLARTPL